MSILAKQQVEIVPIVRLSLLQRFEAWLQATIQKMARAGFWVLVGMVIKTLWL